MKKAGKAIRQWIETHILKKQDYFSLESSPSVLPLPSSVYLELTNFCNLRCVMCTFHSPSSPFLVDGNPPRKRGFMDKGLAFRIVDELGSGDIPITLSLHGAGEPLLHKDLAEVLNRASRYRQIYVGFLTNAMLLDAEVSRRLLDAGLGWISFSIDGNDPISFEAYRRGAKLDVVKKNVMGFLELSQKLGVKPMTQVNMTVQEDMWDQVDDFVDFWLRYVDRVSISPCRPMGSRKSSLVPPETQRIPCPMLFSMMVIYWDGNVGLCCEDWFNDGQMGNLSVESLSSVWKGKRFEWARKMHSKGLYDRVPLCGDCDIWFNGIPEVIHEEKRGISVIKNAWQWEYRKNAL